VRGVGGRPHISAAGKYVQDRDAWLFSGDHITVESVEVSGARSRVNNNGVSGEATLRFSYSHESKAGHLFKIRAASTVVAYNHLADDDAGTSSRSIDLPDGGLGRW